MSAWKLCSTLATSMQRFIDLRRLSGADYHAQALLLGHFDRFLVESNHIVLRLTREITDQYECSLERLASRSRGNRLCVVRQFGKYLARTDALSYVPDSPRCISSHDAHTPYIYSLIQIRDDFIAQGQLIKGVLPNIPDVDAIGDQLGIAFRLYQAGEYRAAFAWALRSSEGGSIAAHCLVGDCYRLGKGTRRDLAQAQAYYRKAADEQNQYAVEMLDAMHAPGESDQNGSPEMTVLDDKRGESPVIRMTNAILLKAIERGATAIELEPRQEGLAITFEIDGKLVPQWRAPLRLSPHVSARLREMAGLPSKRSDESDLRAQIAPHLEATDVTASRVDDGDAGRFKVRMADQSRCADVAFTQSDLGECIRIRLERGK